MCSLKVLLTLLVTDIIILMASVVGRALSVLTVRYGLISLLGHQRTYVQYFNVGTAFTLLNMVLFVFGEIFCTF